MTGPVNGPSTGPVMGFVGVDTAHSSIMKVFPLWADHLGLPTRELRGHDVPLDAPDDTYRDLVRAIRDDEHHLGALVTTHKVRVFEAAHDLFDELDALSEQCGEISSISKRDGRLLGGAKDPLTAGCRWPRCCRPTGSPPVARWCAWGRVVPGRRSPCTLPPSTSHLR